MLRGTGLDVPLSTSASSAANAALLQPSLAMAKLWETLKLLEGGAGQHTERSAELVAQRSEAEVQLEEIKRQEKGIERALRTVQELEGVAWSLGGLLDAKMGKLRQACLTLAQMEKEFVAKCGRRRVRELAAVLQSSGASLTHPLEVDDDEEGDGDGEGAAVPRAPRQRRAKRSEEDGWETSSAEEADRAECSKDRSAFCVAAHKQIVADVDENFSSASAVLKSLSKAKERLQAHGEYAKAYVHLALPEALSLYVEHSLLWWDPLQLCHAEDSTLWGPRGRVSGHQLENFDWFEDLAKFTELLGDDDPDAELVPRLVQRCIFPEVARRLRDCWDVTSLRQSARVAAMLDECLLFEVEPAKDASTSDTGFAGLLEVALSRIENCLKRFAPEVFVPNDALPQWYASPARLRLLRRSVKVAHCAAQLEGRLPDSQLAPLLLTHIFATRIAPHLRAPRLDPEEMDLVSRFVALLPARWLECGVPQVLWPLRDALGPRAPSGPQSLVTAKAAALVLQRLRCFDEAQAILDKL